MKSPTAKKLPSGNWRAQVTVKGVHYSVTKETKKEAEKAALMMKLSPSQKASKMTYGEAIDYYISKYEKTLSPSTVKTYKDVRRLRFQSIMDMPINTDINMQAVIDMENLAPSTLRTSYAVISVSLKELKLAPQKVRFAKDTPEERPFLDPDEIKIFCKSIEGDMYELPYLLCLHSLRCSEMLALKKSQVKGGFIHVSGAMVRGEGGYVFKKSNKTDASARMIPILIPRIEELVSQCPEGTLCPYSARGMTAHLQTILRHNHLPVCSLHSLRHSFASLCYYNNLATKTIMRLGGWKDYRTLMKIYTHLAQRQLTEDIAKLRQALSDN